MPASTLDPIDAALRATLAKNESENTLDSQLAGSTKKVLLSDIEFDNCGSYQKKSALDNFKSKCLIHLKSSDSLKVSINNNNNNSSSSSSKQEDMGADESLKIAKCELFPLEAVQLGWKNGDWSIGAGMVNMGNTCYLNSTLQALFHVPAFANWLISDKEHTVKCEDSGGLSCIICAMRKTLIESQRTANSIRPLLIYNKLRLVCRNLIPGRQEDAHEFLRYLVEAMEKAYLSRFKNHTDFDSRTKETTPLNQILGGYLRSAVRCLECGHVSTTFQHFQDLLLDIRKAQTIEEALEGYFSREKLDDESYHCEACRRKVQATKQFSLERAPMVLCIQLKRFSVSNNKITKHIIFRHRLDLAKYMRYRSSVSPLNYKLVAMVTHMGPTVGCGHYTAVAQVPSGSYYQFDDSMVRPISHHIVFNTNAYIMFYELESPPYRDKPATITNSSALANKVKAQATSVVESKECTSTSNSRVFLNGLTSSKPYGPELPPERLLVNGLVSSSASATLTSNTSCVNGGSSNAAFIGRRGQYSPSDTSSDSEMDTHKSSGHQQKENRPSTGTIKLASASSTVTTSDLRISKPPLLTVKSPNCTDTNSTRDLHQVTSSSNSCSNEALTTSGLGNREPVGKRPLKEGAATQIHLKAKLVPYEADDSSTNSDDISTREQEGEREVTSGRVPIKAASASGKWQVSSTTDILVQEPTSSASDKDRGSTSTITRTSTGSETGNKTIKSGANGGNNLVLKELFKMSHNGYSEPVSAWNGTKSHLTKEVLNERREDRKRVMSADNNEEHSRSKHQKINNMNNYKSNPGYNPIQEYHNNRNWNHGGNRRYYKHLFYSGSNRHRRNNFHHKGHKNFRFRQ